MLYLIPAPLHRVGLRIAHAMRKLLWRLRRSRVVGCSVVALDESGCVLLVRHSYGSGRWAMPGGGLARNEEPVDGAVRELREETGCILVEAQEIMTILERRSGAASRVHMVAGRTSSDLKIDGREVIEARFFPLDRLPRDIMRNLTERIPLWVEIYDAYNSES